MAGILKYHRNKQYTVISEFVVTRVYCTAYYDTIIKILFSVAAPILWNSLPDDLRASDELCPFKRNLKTFLFNSAYNVRDD